MDGNKFRVQDNLQTFDMSIKHIKVTDNGTVDWLSRLNSIEATEELSSSTDIKIESQDYVSNPIPMYTPRQSFERVHGVILAVCVP